MYSFRGHSIILVEVETNLCTDGDLGAHVYLDGFRPSATLCLFNPIYNDVSVNVNPFKLSSPMIPIANLGSDRFFPNSCQCPV